MFLIWTPEALFNYFFWKKLAPNLFFKYEKTCVKTRVKALDLLLSSRACNQSLFISHFFKININRHQTRYSPIHRFSIVNWKLAGHIQIEMRMIRLAKVVSSKIRIPRITSLVVIVIIINLRDI